MNPTFLEASGTGSVLFGLQTPLQLTTFVFWLVIGLAFMVGIVYVVLLVWTLSRHISHEPLARTRKAPPRARHPPESH